MWSLLVVLEGVYIKRDHINHGFGPDVVTPGVNPPQNNPNWPHLAQTQGLENLGLGQMWSHENTSGINMSQNNQKSPHLPKPRFWARKPGFGPDVVVLFVCFGWVNFNFDGFPWVFDPPWPQSSQNGFPIVQLMFLYEARSYRNIIRTIGTPFLRQWDQERSKKTQKPSEMPFNMVLYACTHVSAHIRKKCACPSSRCRIGGS